MNLISFENSKEKLGLDYSENRSIFRVWAPSRDRVDLAIYDDYDDLYRNTYQMDKRDGVFEYTINEDLDGKFYTYIVDGREVTDPYSFAVSVNSKKSAIIDLEDTNPEGFKDHSIPYNPWQEAIIMEGSIADFTASRSSGVKHRGKFLGACQRGSKFEGYATGIDHLKELGITHFHLMPVYDFITMDESKDVIDYPYNYNWGYDPELYNCVEGSFSTDPFDPKKRIMEFKQLIQSLHEEGISVVMDVVYNHTYKTLDSNFQTLEPNYYYRNISGHFYNGSGCGNEFASENIMARKFILESLKYWVEEYKIDGFRFDLMGLIDIETMQLIVKELRQINPNIIIYGEPWMAQTSLLPYEKQINIGMQQEEGFSIFNPFYRDQLKGDNDGHTKGYLQGEYFYKDLIEKGIAGSVSNGGFFSSPIESINYFNAHDNLIFYDKLIKSAVSPAKTKDITRMAFSILLMSQGIPFFHLGNEFERSKYMNMNSYNASIEINQVDWSLKKKNYDLFEEIVELIKLRKSLNIFNMKTKEEVKRRLKFIKGLKDHIIGYKIKEEENYYLILHNVSDHIEFLNNRKLNIEKFGEKIYGNSEQNEDGIEINPYSSAIYFFKEGLNGRL